MPKLRVHAKDIIAGEDRIGATGCMPEGTCKVTGGIIAGEDRTEGTGCMHLEGACKSLWERINWEGQDACLRTHVNHRRRG
jgi:hypothetical protein